MRVFVEDSDVFGGGSVTALLPGVVKIVVGRRVVRAQLIARKARRRREEVTEYGVQSTECACGWRCWLESGSAFERRNSTVGRCANV